MRSLSMLTVLSLTLATHSLFAADEDITFRLSIRAQALPTALQEFAKQTGLQVVYFAQVADSAGTTQSIEGQYRAEEALDQILNGTDLVYSSIDERTYSIRKRDGDSAGGAEKRLPVAMAGTPVAQASMPIESAANVKQDSAADNVPVFIDEIVVRSQIREESYQDVPVTATVFDGNMLEANRMLEIGDVARFTPGFAASNFNNSSPNYSIRGAMNTFSQAGVSKPVGVFVDDVYIPRYSAASFELFDIEQLSVLKGPQGTLFGRNVTGGAIQIFTTKPALDDAVFKVRTGVGNYNLVEAAALASGPLSDSVAGKMSIARKVRDGYSVDRFNGRDVEDQDSIFVRGSMLFAPTEKLSIQLDGDFSHDENGSKGYNFISSLDGTDLTGNDGNARTTELRIPQSYERDILGVTGHIDWALDAGDLQSITAWRRSDSREYYSLGAADVMLPSVSVQFIKDDNDEPTSFSQEFRFISKRGERFDFVAGVYFYKEENDRFLGDELLGLNGTAVFVDRDFAVRANTESLAGYFNAIFHFGAKLDVGVGGRYTSEQKDVDVVFVDNNNASSNFSTAPSNDFTEFTPRITLTYFPTDNITLFASRTEGFTAGGFNTETNNQGAVESGFEPETITAYELGTKSRWLDGGLVVNLTLFDQEYENKQEGILLPGNIFSILNASEASMKGAELEVVWDLTDSLSASLGYSKLDTEYDSFVFPDGDFTGNELQTAPENSFSLALDYSREAGREGYINAGLSYTWQDEYFTGASNIDDFLIDSYGLVNARIGYEWAGGKWGVRLWGNNLANEEFVQIRGTVGAIAEYYGAPRTYGIGITYASE